jgi:nucleoside-diphosphate-sugar epimerase
MKIFVTGGSGFIGSAICKQLVSQGHAVTGLVRRKSKADIVEQTGATAVVGDLLEADAWTVALRDADLIISASQPVRHGEKVSLSEARRRSYYHGQMVGNLFLAAEGSGVKGVIVSYGVQGFGNRGDQWVMENDEINPYGYERSVSGAYWHIDKTSRKTRVPLVNIFTGWVYGPGSWFETLVRGIRNGTMRIIGEGNNYMSFIHVDDLARAYGRMAETLPFGERYCLVDGNPATQREMANFIARMIGGRTPKSVETEAYARLAGDLAAESFSCSTRVLGERSRRILMPELQYASYTEGMPAVIDEMGILHREERAA